jgi:hypothetical protein
MSVMSKRLAWKASAVSALYGPDHQVTTAETAPAKAAAASSSHPVLTASQRRLVMLWVQANWFVPVSSSLATIGAPQNSPGSSGTADVATTIVATVGLPRERFEPARLAEAGRRHIFVETGHQVSGS